VLRAATTSVHGKMPGEKWLSEFCWACDRGREYASVSGALKTVWRTARTGLFGSSWSGYRPRGADQDWMRSGLGAFRRCRSGRMDLDISCHDDCGTDCMWEKNQPSPISVSLTPSPSWQSRKLPFPC